MIISLFIVFYKMHRINTSKDYLTLVLALPQVIVQVGILSSRGDPLIFG